MHFRTFQLELVDFSLEPNVAEAQAAVHLIALRLFFGNARLADKVPAANFHRLMLPIIDLTLADRALKKLLHINLYKIKSGVMFGNGHCSSVSSGLASHDVTSFDSLTVPY